MLLSLVHAMLEVPARLRKRVYTVRLRRQCSIHPQASLTPEAKIFNSIGADAVRIGEQTLMMGELLVIAPHGRIAIGDWCYIGPTAKLWSAQSIAVGHRVFISHGVQIFDNNSHSLSASERHARYRELRTVGRHLEQENVTSRAVVIEDDVWIGFNAAVLKGVRIGKGAVIGACAVVVDDVPEYAVMVGNPARQIAESRA